MTRDRAALAAAKGAADGIHGDYERTAWVQGAHGDWLAQHVQMGKLLPLIDPAVANLERLMQANPADEQLPLKRALLLLDKAKITLVHPETAPDLDASERAAADATRALSELLIGNATTGAAKNLLRQASYTWARTIMSRDGQDDDRDDHGGTRVWANAYAQDTAAKYQAVVCELMTQTIALSAISAKQPTGPIQTLVDELERAGHVPQANDLVGPQGPLTYCHFAGSMRPQLVYPAPTHHAVSMNAGPQPPQQPPLSPPPPPPMPGSPPAAYGGPGTPSPPHSTHSTDGSS